MAISGQVEKYLAAQLLSKGEWREHSGIHEKQEIGGALAQQSWIAVLCAQNLRQFFEATNAGRPDAPGGNA